MLYSTYFYRGMELDARRFAEAHAVLDARSRTFIPDLKNTLRGFQDSLEPPPSQATLRKVREGDPWCAISQTTIEFLDALRKAAESHRAVFAYGESGSGKHLAQATLLDWRRCWDPDFLPHEVEPEPIVLAIPPLRDRLQDIPALAERYLSDPKSLTAARRKHLTRDAEAELMRRKIRGNVSELYRILHRAWVNASTRLEVDAADLPRDVQPAPLPDDYGKDEGQRQAMLRLLRMGGNISAAAHLDGVSRAAFWGRMRRLGILRLDATSPHDDTLRVR